MSDNLWEEFEKYLNVVQEFASIYNINPKISLVEEIQRNYSSFPNANDIINSLFNYCEKYIREHEPKDFGNDGRLYTIDIPEEIFGEKPFFDSITCRVRLLEDGSCKNKVLEMQILKNEMKPMEEKDFEYVKEHEKLKNITIYIGGKITKEGKIDPELMLNFAHEMLHAYEDYKRVINGSKSILQYNDATNYSDWYIKRNSNPYNNILCTLFNIFNNTEIRAFASEFQAEMTMKEVDELYPFLSDLKNKIQTTKKWQELEMIGGYIEKLNTVEDHETQNNLVKLFNEHSVRKKVKDFNELIKFLRERFWNVRNDLYKKFSKIIYQLWLNKKEKWMS